MPAMTVLRRLWDALDVIRALVISSSATGLDLRSTAQGVAAALIVGGLFAATPAQAQDPAQPPTNFALTSALDGAPPAPGLYWFEYLQYYDAPAIKNGQGNDIGTASVNSLLFMQQLAYISPVRVLGGHLGGTTLIPIVTINTDGGVGPNGAVPLTRNKSVFGDIVVGPLIQWFDKRLFQRPFFHRLEVDFLLPVGSHDDTKLVNPSSGFLTIEPHYTFTLFLTDKLTTTQRHHFTYNFEDSDTNLRTGAMYHANYALNYNVWKTLRLGVTGYYIRQLAEDTADGSSSFFETQFGIRNTKEQAFAIGPNVCFITPGGIFLEASTVFETAVENRPSGTRATLRVNVPLSLHTGK